MLNITIILVLSLFAVFIDTSTALLLCGSYLFSFIFIYKLSRKDILNNSIKLFKITYICCLGYMFVCYIYMTFKGYDHLLAYDIGNYFLPMVNKYLENGDLNMSLKTIWSDYALFSRSMPGYFSVIMLFAYLSDSIGSDLYIALQMSSLVFYLFFIIVVYHIFCLFLSKKKSYTCVLLISLFSLSFFYSTQILRDIHIALFAIIIIYYVLKNEYRNKEIALMVGFSIMTMTFRVESGIFLLIFVIVGVFLNLGKRIFEPKFLLIILFMFVVLFGYIINYKDIILKTFTVNRDIYTSDVLEGNGVIALLQKVPFIGSVLSVLYNFIQPLPFWTRIKVDANFRPEMFNLLTYPYAFSAFFQWSIFCSFFLMFKKDVRRRVYSKINKPLGVVFIFSMIYLLLQSAVISQRRLIPFYIVIYLFAFIIFDKIKNYKNKEIMGAIILTSFIVINLFALIYIL